ncbi:MAG: translesion error-prone DNA polymerase V autoproteolytic subunit [Candidatus Competibacteraceae bacterium]|nr:translesion error-prone DNA polymerase V autoproteolytic subunit [Candidatus Competibacteraceae bacterium]
MRVPVSVAPALERWLSGRMPGLGPELDRLYRPARSARPLELVLFSDSVKAGFPNPAEEYIEGRLNLDQHLIPHTAATFFVRVAGDSMVGAGIHPGDLLIVDRSLEAAHGRVVIAVVDNELTVKLLHCRDGSIRLLAENDRYPPIELAPGMTLEVWGVVTNVIHAL